MSLENPSVPSASPPPPEPSPQTPASPAPSSAAVTAKLGIVKRIWNYLTSFHFAVLILSLSMLVVFLGTLAQVHEGLYLAQTRWFKSWWILRQAGDPWWVPPIFTGGYLLGTLFLVNMLGAHFRRLKYPPGGLTVMIVHYLLVMAALFLTTKTLLWLPFYFVLSQLVLMVVDMVACLGNKRMEASGRKIGVDLVHLGIAVLLLGQLSTDLFAKETHLAFREGETKHYSESHMDTELAVVRSVDEKNDEVTAVPGDLLTVPGKNLSAAKLPFSLQVKSWMVNSDLVDRQECRAQLMVLTGQQLPPEMEALLSQEASMQLATMTQAMATLESKYSSVSQLSAAASEALSGAPGRREIWNQALQAVGEPAGADPVKSAERLAGDAAKGSKLLTELKTRFRREMLSRFQMQGGAMSFTLKAFSAAANPADSMKMLEDSFPKPQASTPVAGRYFAVQLPETRAMDARNIPSAVVELTNRDGSSMGSFLLTPNLKEQRITVGDAEYRLSLRMARAYHPFAMTLLKTTHDKYPGTDMPKDFRSRVRIQEDNEKGDRETEIFMNSPLRFENGNLTFFQSQMGRDQSNAAIGTSSLQVVQNPGWFSPYFGCALVAYGMCRHFLLHLGRFISRKKAK